MATQRRRRAATHGAQCRITNASISVLQPGAPDLDVRQAQQTLVAHAQRLLGGLRLEHPGRAQGLLRLRPGGGGAGAGGAPGPLAWLRIRGGGGGGGGAAQAGGKQGGHHEQERQHEPRASQRRFPLSAKQREQDEVRRRRERGV